MDGSVGGDKMGRTGGGGAGRAEWEEREEANFYY